MRLLGLLRPTLNFPVFYKQCILSKIEDKCKEKVNILPLRLGEYLWTSPQTSQKLIDIARDIENAACYFAKRTAVPETYSVTTQAMRRLRLR
jgi:hypothetical protein